jgi:hypothetical protein
MRFLMNINPRSSRSLRGQRGRARWLPLAAAALALTASLTACKREEVGHTRVPKAPPFAPPGAPASPEGAPSGTTGRSGAAPGGGGDVPAPPRPQAGLAWTLPKGWQETREGAGMRYATLKPAVKGNGKIDVSVVVLPGPAGGELANVNRWRGQIGLPAIGDPELAAARKTLKSKAGSVSLYDYTSEGNVKTRLVAGLLSSQGNSWFFKMVGDADTIGAARTDFVALLESLRLE